MRNQDGPVSNRHCMRLGTEGNDQLALPCAFQRFQPPARVARKLSVFHLFLTRVVEAIDISRNPRRLLDYHPCRGRLPQHLYINLSPLLVPQTLTAAFDACDQIGLSSRQPVEPIL